MHKTSNKHLNKIMQENENFFLFLFSEVPYSGWKIHISCTFRNYNLIFNIVSEYCYEKRLSFKVIKNIDLYFKNGDRSSYGKFITIYIKTEESFVNHMEEFYKDVLNTFKEDNFYDANQENHEKSFLGGKEEILCILNMVDKKLAIQKIFPFIL